MLCLAGHGRGVDDIIGIEEDGGMRTVYGGYQNDFALQCVEHGYAVLAIEQFGFGHRRDSAARQRGAGNSSCQPSAGAAFLLGQTMVGWRVYDAMRALDYLATRPEIDSQRVGIMGISGGWDDNLLCSRPGYALQSSSRERLFQHVPRQHPQSEPLYRQLYPICAKIRRDV